MYKKLYLDYLEKELKELLPRDYSVKVVQEVSYSADAREDERTIIAVVRFGVASKKTYDPGSIYQPVLFTIYTEANSIAVAQGLFNDFFLAKSKVYHTLSNDDTTYFIMPTYNSPVGTSYFNIVNGAKRGLLNMTGVLSISENNVLGVQWLLNGIEVFATEQSCIFSSSFSTPHVENDVTGVVNIEGSNNSFSFNVVLKNIPILKALLDIAINGASNTNNEYELSIIYGDLGSYLVPIRITNVQTVYNVDTGETTLMVTAIRREGA